MVEIAPKTLRFARLAAAQQAAFSSDPQIAIIEQEESRFSGRGSRDRIEKYVDISEQTADFCYRAVTALLETPEVFSTSNWDGNDFAFMQAFAKALRAQLEPSNARRL